MRARATGRQAGHRVRLTRNVRTASTLRWSPARGCQDPDIATRRALVITADTEMKGENAPWQKRLLIVALLNEGPPGMLMHPGGATAEHLLGGHNLSVAQGGEGLAKATACVVGNLFDGRRSAELDHGLRVNGLDHGCSRLFALTDHDIAGQERADFGSAARARLARAGLHAPRMT